MRLKADRKILAASGAIIIAGLCLFMLNLSVSVKKERTALQARRQGLLQLRDEYQSLKTAVDAVEGKKSLTKVEGIVQAIDEIFRSMGLNQKLKSVKSLGVRDKKFGTEEEAELQVEKVNMNEMTNILYRIENAPMVLSIKKTTIKTSFDNPSLLNLTMTIGLTKAK